MPNNNQPTVPALIQLLRMQAALEILHGRPAVSELMEHSAAALEEGMELLANHIPPATPQADAYRFTMVGKCKGVPFWIRDKERALELLDQMNPGDTCEAFQATWHATAITPLMQLLADGAIH